MRGPVKPNNIGGLIRGCGLVPHADRAATGVVPSTYLRGLDSFKSDVPRPASYRIGAVNNTGGIDYCEPFAAHDYGAFPTSVGLISEPHDAIVTGSIISDIPFLFAGCESDNAEQEVNVFHGAKGSYLTP